MQVFSPIIDGILNVSSFNILIMVDTGTSAPIKNILTAFN